eukprot:6450825-Heterocapsa_arctica.AAC.1
MVLDTRVETLSSPVRPAPPQNNVGASASPGIPPQWRSHSRSGVRPPPTLVHCLLAQPKNAT